MTVEYNGSPSRATKAHAEYVIQVSPPPHPVMPAETQKSLGCYLNLCRYTRLALSRFWTCSHVRVPACVFLRMLILRRGVR